LIECADRHAHPGGWDPLTVDANAKKEPVKLPALSLKDKRDIGFGFLDLRVDRGVLLI